VFAIILYGREQTMGHIRFESGDFWMLGAAITFGYYSFCVADKPKSLPYLAFFAASVIVGTLFCLPMLLWDTFTNPLFFVSNMSFDIFAILLFLGVFNSVLAYLLWNYALTKGDPIKVSMIYYLMPVFSTVESWLILHDSIHWIQIVGSFVVFGGIYYSTKSPSQKKRSST
jgi:drug/metabolite transporter (DMT)-like permease